VPGPQRGGPTSSHNTRCKSPKPYYVVYRIAILAHRRASGAVPNNQAAVMCSLLRTHHTFASRPRPLRETSGQGARGDVTRWVRSQRSAHQAHRGRHASNRRRRGLWKACGGHVRGEGSEEH
jgi:hypothetical protein